METSHTSRPSTVNSTRSAPVKALPSVPDPSLYLSGRLNSERLPEAYRLLAQARESLEGLGEAAAQVQAGLHAVENDLKLLTRREEESDRGAEMSLSTPRDDIDGLFTQVKKAVFLADAQVDRFCFKHKSTYSDKERKKAVTGALEKMANDIWAALIATVHKPAKVQLAEAQQALSALHAQATSLSTGLSAALEEVEEVLYNHLAEGVRVPVQLMATERKSRPEAPDSQRGAQTTRENRPLPGAKEEFAADLQEDGRRMLASFEKYASTRGGRSSSVSAVRKEMNRILKDMVTTVQLNCAGFGPTADAETWRMKKQALRIKKRIDGLCKGLDEKESTSMHDYSIASVPTSYLGRDTPSFDTGRNTPSFDTPDRGTPSRGLSVEPPFPSEPSDLQSEENGHSRTLSQGFSSTEEKQGTSREARSSVPDRTRPGVAQARSIHARQEVLNMDIADIRRKLDDLFPASRSKSRTESGSQLGLLKTLAPELTGSDQEFIQQFTEQVSKERQATAALLSTLHSAGTTVSSVEEAGTEYLRLKESLHALKREHEEYVLRTLRSQSDSDLNSELDKSLLKQLQAELKQLKEAGRIRSLRQAVASQTAPLALTVQAAGDVSIAPSAQVFTLSEESAEMTFKDVTEIEVAAGSPDVSLSSEMTKTQNVVKAALSLAKHTTDRKADGRGRRQPTKKASGRLTTVQEAVLELEDSMEHEEEKKAAIDSDPQCGNNPASSKSTPTSEKRVQGAAKGSGKVPVTLPMSYFKAKALSKDSGSHSAGKLVPPIKLEEMPAENSVKMNAKSVVSVSLLQESRGKVPIPAATEQLIKSMVGSKFTKVAESLISEAPDKPPTPKSATLPNKRLPVKETAALFGQTTEESSRLVTPKGKSAGFAAKTATDLKGKQLAVKEPVLAERKSEGAKPAAVSKPVATFGSGKKPASRDKLEMEEIGKSGQTAPIGKLAIPKLSIPLKSSSESSKKEPSPPVTFRPIPEVLASEAANESSEVVIEGEEIEFQTSTPQEVELAAGSTNQGTDKEEPEGIIVLNQLVAEKVELLKSITDEEAAIEAEISSIAFATMEEQYIEAKLLEWAAFPDLARMCRLSHDLRQTQRRYDEIFREIQSLQDHIQLQKFQQTCKLVLLPSTPQAVEELQAMLHCPAEVCGRVSFETWEWALVRIEEVCVWVRPGVPSDSLSLPEMAEKYREATRLLGPQLPGDLVLATAQLLQRT